MNRFLSRIVAVLLCTIACLAGRQASATHLYGADLAYTYISGNTYKITLTLYGNCAGGSFPSLIGSTAQVLVYNGSLQVTTLTLPQESAPLEVTPVCAAQASQTACVITNTTVPGIKRFTYSTTYNINSTSANWRFRFDGNAGGSTGRSNDISNIAQGSTMALEATLNNTLGPNSSPTYTTIPTPFFCVSKPASYNPGTIDADGDDLTFLLVPGIVPISGTVSYYPGFSGSNPLQSMPGTFTFSATTGQLDFTPSVTQKSLVVSQVSEYRNGTLVGTSMREMTFVVLPCANNPPGGVISTPSTGLTMINTTTVSICSEKGPFTFSINPTDADGNLINMTANGLPTGATFNISNNGSTAPTGTFSWNTAGVAPGDYTFFITYLDNGCPLVSKQTVAYTVTILPNPTLIFQLISPATCFAKAVFTVTPANVASPYTIGFGTTTRSSTGAGITDSLAPGTYTFTVTAPNSCSHDTSITITSPSQTVLSAGVRQNTCNGTADGSVTLTGSNGQTPYTYAQGAGAYSATGSFGPLATGSYVFHIKDGMGCMRDTTITISDSLAVHAALAVTNVLCNGNASGALTVTGSGSINPYQYALNSGAFAAGGAFPNLAAGTYAVHLRDSKGCFKDTSASITEPPVLGVTATVSPVTCNGGSNGAVALTASGGAPGYTYAIGTGTFGTGSSFTALAAGIYVFHIRDNNGCQKDTTIAIVQPAPLAATLQLSMVRCSGNTDGSITVTASGGTPAFTYALNAGAFGNANAFTGLGAGVQAIHLKDANGCVKDTSVTITQPAILHGTYTAVNPTCSGTNNGTITISGSGGTTPYTYALNSNAFAASGAITALAPGAYAVHLKDANGCLYDTTATLVSPPAVTVAAALRRPRCTPLVNGMVTLSAGGGTPGYTYAVGPGTYVASPVFSNLGSGTYTFHIRDNQGCTKDTLIVLTDSVAVHAATTLAAAKCFGSADGSITVVPAGGDAPYTFAVNATPYAATNPITNLGAATYTLHVKDANGCVLDTAQTIVQPSILIPAITITQPLCNGGTDGQLMAAATGGTPAYTFANGSGAFGASGTFGSLTAGTYTVHLKDANSCTHDTTVIIGQPTPLSFVSLMLSHNFCHGDSSGFVKIIAAGGTPGYTYAADARAYQAGTTVTNLKAGQRVIRVKDAHGCTLDTSIVLNEPARAYVLVDTLTNPTCEGYADGSIRISAGGGTPGYTYAPASAVFDTVRAFSGIAEGAHVFYAKDHFGCTVDTTVNFTGYPHILLNAAIITDASCHGLSDGMAQLQVSGGNQPLAYYMALPADTNATGRFDSLKKGTYAIHIVDRTGCFKDTTVRINQPDTLMATATATPNDCQGYDDGGSAIVAVNGGTAPYSYLWSGAPGQNADRITGLGNGRYAVVVTDAHHCTDTASAVVGYDNCCVPLIPNAFTPNNDGRNDRFHIVFKGDMKLENFSIFNRFGQRVFYTTSTEDGWDGTWNDRPQDAATYFYYIKLICGNKGDNELEFKGDLTLIR